MIKIEFDADWNTWTVEYGTYYGVVNPAKHSWMVERTNDQATAERIGRNAERITAALGDRKHVRLTITFHNDKMMITNYDWDTIIATDVPALV